MGDVGGVLRRDDDVHDLDGLVVLVAHGDLRLGVRPQPVDRARLANTREFATEAVGKHDGGGHELRRLAAGVAEHDTLVAGTLLGGLLALGLARIDALGNVGRLTREVVIDEDAVRVEHVVRIHVADVADGRAHDGLVVELGGRGDLAGEDDHVRLDHGLAGDAAMAVLREAGVEHAVRNQVGNLVGMAFAHRLRGEYKGISHRREDEQDSENADSQG